MIDTAEPTILTELQRIAAENGGLLRAEDVVDAARDEASPLHASFTWDDNAAAHQYRIWQARRLIGVTVQYLDAGAEPMRIRAFCSLTTDREQKGGGYRTLVTVLSGRSTRKQLLADALAELERLQAKYNQLNELADVFAAVRRVRNKA